MSPQFKYVIELPKLKQFRSRRKLVSPYDLLYQWGLNKTMPHLYLLYEADQYGYPKIINKNLDVSAFWLHPKDHEKLNKITFTWYCNQSKIFSKRYNRRGFSWFELDLSPAMLSKDTKLPSGYLYIRERFLIDRKTYE